MSFANGDVTLAGELLLPKGTGKHAAILFLHGSGGDWQTSSLEEFAADAAAGFALLAQQPEVGALRMGVYGHSQGLRIHDFLGCRFETLFCAGKQEGRRRRKDAFRLSQNFSQEDGKDGKKDLPLLPAFL